MSPMDGRGRAAAAEQLKRDDARRRDMLGPRGQAVSYAIGDKTAGEWTPMEHLQVSINWMVQNAGWGIREAGESMHARLREFAHLGNPLEPVKAHVICANDFPEAVVIGDVPRAQVLMERYAALDFYHRHWCRNACIEAGYLPAYATYRARHHWHLHTVEVTL